MGGMETRKGQIRKTIDEKYREEWKRQIAETARLELLEQVKDTMGMEKYL